MEKQLEKIFSEFQGQKDELIPILQDVQAAFGYLPEEVIKKVAKFAKVAESHIYAVATFYSQFRFTPIGKNRIMVCRGTACHVKGAPLLLDQLETKLGIKDGETTTDKQYTLETVACIGACGLAPTMVVNQDTYGHLSPNKVSKVLAAIEASGKGAESE